jgi:hypothetical protein
MDARALAAVLGVSAWNLYEATKRGDCPVAPIRCGRRLLWPKARVAAALGLTVDELDAVIAQARS